MRIRSSSNICTESWKISEFGIFITLPQAYYIGISDSANSKLKIDPSKIKLPFVFLWLIFVWIDGIYLNIDIVNPQSTVVWACITISYLICLLTEKWKKVIGVMDSFQKCQAK